MKQSATIYAEAIRLKLERLHSGSPTTGTAQPFFISLKICSAINSILHVQQSIQPLAEEIGLYRLRDAVHRNNNNGSLGPTQETLTENAIKDVNEKLDEIFYAIARRVNFFKLIKRFQNLNLCLDIVWSWSGQTDQYCDGIGFRYAANWRSQ